jgi:hypothetical protein
MTRGVMARAALLNALCWGFTSACADTSGDTSRTSAVDGTEDAQAGPHRDATVSCDAIVPNLRGGLVPGRFGRIVHRTSAVRDLSPPCPPWAAEWLARRYRRDLDALEGWLGERVARWRDR